jgi:hypothetical protein
MSANANILRGAETIRSSVRESTLPQVEACAIDHWNSENFAREQIRGLVRRVFFARGDRPAKHVVFSAAEGNIDVAGICDDVARALAEETAAHVAVVKAGEEIEASTCIRASSKRTSIKALSTQIEVNLWRVCRNGNHWLPCLEELRSEFEFAVIQGLAAGISSEATLLGQLTDGIILLLSAGCTRRATARKIKETLEASQCRILGAVLTERTFPIPDRLYRRL